LGETEETISTDNNKKNGTLRIKKFEGTLNSNNKETKTFTLDKLVRDNVRLFSKSKVLKIDTDGYDLKIIRGSMDLIKQNKPIIFFEYDRTYLDAVSDKGLPTLSNLKELGYYGTVFYDNYGRFLLSTKLEDSNLLNQLDAYIEKRSGAFPYYDICLFHKDDTDIFDSLVEVEILINKGLK
jgi:hypothetical protein